jgi:HAD superfamily hydrolase (TIGR01509 family)
MSGFSAIVWDCDGVLIDSEVIACGVMLDHFAALGYRMTLEDFIIRFMGKNFRRICAEIADETGIDIQSGFDADAYKAEQYAAFEKSLLPTAGVDAFLQACAVPVAVASGSELARLHLTLGVTGLRGFFGSHVYSADMVPNGKPAPDIFLYAAQRLGIAPEKCLVIEDGIHGIHGAKAAGMEVWAYLGGSHMTARARDAVLAAKPDRSFETMPALAAAFTQRQLQDATAKAS